MRMPCHRQRSSSKRHAAAGAGATGSVRLPPRQSYRVVMTNVSNHACKVGGAPSVSLLGQGSATLATHVVMTPSQAVSWGKGLKIAPSAPASFTVTLNQGGADPQPLPTCPVVTGISVSFSFTGDETAATLAFPPLPVDTPPRCAPIRPIRCTRAIRCTCPESRAATERREIVRPVRSLIENPTRNGETRNRE